MNAPGPGMMVAMERYPIADSADLAARFPSDFRWGAATASYQIEGGAREGGRGVSIWDTFSHTPGRVLGGDTGDVACDHYHRWREDIAIMRELGLDTYRLSLAWPRFQPTADGGWNRGGTDFYRPLLEGLREAGISPLVTLYHWDLPQWLEDRGGWAGRETPQRFGDYAAHVAAELGDLVDTWSTVNEPWTSAYLGYGFGVHAPGRSDPAAALAAVHHLNLGHGLAARAIRAELGDSAKVSAALNLMALRPADPDSDADREAVRRLDALDNRAFTGPMLDGAYPEDLIADTAHVTDWSFVHDGDVDTAHVRLDLLGVNYYTTTTVRALGEGEAAIDDPRGQDMAQCRVATEGIDCVPQAGEVTAMGWLVDPAGLRDTLVDLSRRYPDLPLVIMENGAAYDDEVVDGSVPDLDRTSYYSQHLSAVADARDAGADVRGYCAWSLLDNFEWSWGYHKRFGIVRVDYATQERLIKGSARWYAEVIAACH